MVEVPNIGTLSNGITDGINLEFDNLRKFHRSLPMSLLKAREAVMRKFFSLVEGA